MRGAAKRVRAKFVEKKQIPPRYLNIRQNDQRVVGIMRGLCWGIRDPPPHDPRGALGCLPSGVRDPEGSFLPTRHQMEGGGGGTPLKIRAKLSFGLSANQKVSLASSVPISLDHKFSSAPFVKLSTTGGGGGPQGVGPPPPL